MRSQESSYSAHGRHRRRQPAALRSWMPFKKPSPSPDIISQGTDVAASPAIGWTVMITACLDLVGTGDNQRQDFEHWFPPQNAPGPTRRGRWCVFLASPLLGARKRQWASLARFSGFGARQRHNRASGTVPCCPEPHQCIGSLKVTIWIFVTAPPARRHRRDIVLRNLRADSSSQRIENLRVSEGVKNLLR